MFNKKLGIILIILTLFCIGATITSVSANNADYNSTVLDLSIEQNIDEENKINANTDDESLISESNDEKLSQNNNDEELESIRGVYSYNSDIWNSRDNLVVGVTSVNSAVNSGGEYLGVTKISSTIEPEDITSTQKTKHYVKYVKVGKYKIKVWSDDSLNTQKNKVIKYLKSHVKKAHKFKVHGYKFKVSAKMYRKILYFNKYGYDGKMGFPEFKVKTKKYYTYKEPIYKTKKITKKVWVYKKVLSGWARWGDDWYDDEYYSLDNYYEKGWEAYGYYSKEYSNGADHYMKLKKKVKKTITKYKIVGYKKIKLKVYAYTALLPHDKLAVQFWGLKNGQKYVPITDYYRLK